MLSDQLTPWQRCSIAALATTGSEGVIVSKTPVSWSMEITTLRKELTAVLAKECVLGFCKQTSKEMRKDSAANTWWTSLALYAACCLPPTSFNLANSCISRGFSYANHKGLPNIAMCFGCANSFIDLQSSASLVFGSCIIRLSSTSSCRPRKGGKRGSSAVLGMAIRADGSNE